MILQKNQLSTEEDIAKANEEVEVLIANDVFKYSSNRASLTT
jgi:hypothetical protein